MKAMFTAIAMVVLMMSSGCMSLWSYRCAEDEIKRERVYASGNKEAIKAIRMGASGDTAIRAVALGDGVGIGIDISNWQALSKHPIRQAGAAVLDAGMLYGAYLGIKELQDSGGDDSDGDATGRDKNTISIDGDGNNVNIGDQSTTQPSAAPVEDQSQQGQ